jgi:hypothetical protein
MVFDEAELAALRKNAPDFKESFDMGMYPSSCSIKSDDVGSDESNRCPNIWLEDKYLPGLKATAQAFMVEGTSDLKAGIVPILTTRSKAADADSQGTGGGYARHSCWLL